MAAGSCPHGFAQAECLICRTLGQHGTSRTPVSQQQAPMGPEGASLPSPQLYRGDTASPAARPNAGPPRTRSIGAHLAGVVVAVIVIGLIAWLVAGAVFAILHVLELVVVAGAAGWAGYRLGHFRGRRARS